MKIMLWMNRYWNTFRHTTLLIQVQNKYDCKNLKTHIFSVIWWPVMDYNNLWSFSWGIALSDFIGLNSIEYKIENAFFCLITIIYIQWYAVLRFSASILCRYIDFGTSQSVIFAVIHFFFFFYEKSIYVWLWIVNFVNEMYWYTFWLIKMIRIWKKLFVIYWKKKLCLDSCTESLWNSETKITTAKA